MSLNQVRVLSAGAGVLAVFALNRSNPKNENSGFQTKKQILSIQEKVQFSKLENVSNRLNLVECSNSDEEESLEDRELPIDLSSVNPNDQDRQSKANEVLKNAIMKSRELCWSKIHESAIPGLVVAVSVNGRLIWKLGFGFADVENRLLANPSSVMRIASISKSLTMTVVAKLWEEGKLDLDKSVRHYVPEWPERHPDITVRQLVSHLSGIRHYDKKKEEKTEETNKETEEEEKEKSNKDGNGTERQKKRKKRNGNGSHDTEFKEFYLNRKFNSVSEALDLFKNDDLLSNPGDEFHYTTHGFTLLSAVVESVVGEPFEKFMKRFFKELGLNNTYLDENEPLIYNRARFYTRNKDHKLVNAANVDNSYKWAGGGFLSNVTDLISFGNAMLYSYQAGSNQISPDVKDVGGTSKTGKPNELKSMSDDQSLTDVVHNSGPYSAVNRVSARGKQPYLKPETMRALWSPVIKMNSPDSLNQENNYGMGWMVVPPSSEFVFCKDQRYFVSHTGGAIGASSVLLILPPGPEPDHLIGDQNTKTLKMSTVDGKSIPEGVVVTIICNIDSVGMTQLAFEIAKNFEAVKFQNNAYKVSKVFLC